MASFGAQWFQRTDILHSSFRDAIQEGNSEKVAASAAELARRHEDFHRQFVMATDIYTSWNSPSQNGQSHWCRDHRILRASLRQMFQLDTVFKEQESFLRNAGLDNAPLLKQRAEWRESILDHQHSSIFIDTFTLARQLAQDWFDYAEAVNQEEGFANTEDPYYGYRKAFKIYRGFLTSYGMSGKRSAQFALAAARIQTRIINLKSKRGEMIVGEDQNLFLDLFHTLLHQERKGRLHFESSEPVEMAVFGFGKLTDRLPHLPASFYEKAAMLFFDTFETLHWWAGTMQAQKEAAARTVQMMETAIRILEEQGETMEKLKVQLGDIAYKKAILKWNKEWEPEIGDVAAARDSILNDMKVHFQKMGIWESIAYALEVTESPVDLEIFVEQYDQIRKCLIFSILLARHQSRVMEVNKLSEALRVLSSLQEWVYATWKFQDHAAAVGWSRHGTNVLVNPDAWKLIVGQDHYRIVVPTKISFNRMGVEECYYTFDQFREYVGLSPADFETLLKRYGFDQP